METLITACGDDYWSVRTRAGWGVAKIGGAKAAEALIALFNDPIMEVRNEAVAAVVFLGEGQVDRLLAAMKDERWRVREHAAKACGDLRSRRAVDALMCQLTLSHVRFEPARDPSGRAVAQDVTCIPNWWRP